MSTTITRYPSPPARRDAPKINGLKKKIPLKHMLRLSNTTYFPAPIAQEPEPTETTAPGGRRGTLERGSPELVVSQPVRNQPDYSVEGQNGLIKHVMLNDRKRVLTIDTAGEVVMWDLLKCVPIKSFGKRHLEDVKDEVTTTANVANWCTVDTRTGSVAVVLEENNCFDAEMYADELELDEDIEFRDDQRINLGKWVLRYLFSNLITEEIRRDQTFRKELLSNQETQKALRENAPQNLQMPPPQQNGWHADAAGPPSASTVKPTNGHTTVQTPGLGSIGLATPGLTLSQTKSAGLGATTLVGEDGEPLDRQPTRQSVDRNSDYFSASRLASSEITSPGGAKIPVTPGEGAEEPTTPAAEGTPSKDTPTKGEGLFGKKFRMGMSFKGMKNIGRAAATDKDKPAAVEEKEETESDSRSSKTSNSRVVDDNLLGTVQKMRFAYEDSLQAQLSANQAFENGLPGSRKSIDLPSAITPSLPAETPVLKPPLNTTILIQEDRPEAGGVADLFEGTVGALGEMCDIVEKAAPMWLGEVLLKNQIPFKDIVKLSFVLEPWHDKSGAVATAQALPSIAADGNNRLNANRMLRAKKILAYVAERIEPAAAAGEEEGGEAQLRPEEYLELWCQGQVSFLLCD